MASSCVQTYDYNAATGVHHLKMACITHTDGTFTATATAPPNKNGGASIDGYVFMVVLDEGATAFTDTDTDVTLKNSAGLDILSGKWVGVLTGDAMAAPELESANNYIGEVYVDGNLTLYILNNAVDSATLDIHIYWRNF